MSSDTPDHLDPAKWADVLGLLPLSDSSLKIQNETVREFVFEKFHSKARIHRLSGVAAENLQRDLWAKFTSKYLHLLVDRIINLPPPSFRLADGADEYPLQNIYHLTLKSTDNAYLARFMTSTHPIAEGGKRLSRVMAERLVEFGPCWHRNKNPSYERCIHSAVTTLMKLVVAAKGHDIPKRTRGELVYWLDTWASYGSWSARSMTINDTLPMACTFLSSLLKPRGAVLTSLIKQRRRALKCVEVCALPACAIKSDLKVCAKCKTVAYCSEAHQRMHWKHEHKKRCFETEY